MIVRPDEPQWQSATVSRAVEGSRRADALSRAGGKNSPVAEMHTLRDLRGLETRLQGASLPRETPGVDASTALLGMGLFCRGRHGVWSGMNGSDEFTPSSATAKLKRARSGKRACPPTSSRSINFCAVLDWNGACSSTARPTKLPLGDVNEKFARSAGTRSN